MTKKKKLPARRRPARRQARKASTAIATRQDVARFKIDDPNGMLSPASPEGFELGELAHTGGVGIGTVKLSAGELKIISRAVNQPDVRVLPDSGLAYLPHLYYTRWLNEAFGPTGWGIVPMSAPKKVDNLIIIPHALYIRGVAVAWAYGAAEYHEKNKRQTYDDVLESCVAYSLRRCCKRLGMALELWDKRWLAKFLAADCIKVNTSKGWKWRRKDDEPFEDERGQAPAATTVHEGEVVGADGNSKEKISKEQIKRLVGIWRTAGRADADVQFWLKKKYGYKATADIKRFDYDRIERELTARGDLLLPGDE
jgi:hypothetical protein